MSLNTIIRIPEHTPRADKSAVCAINRHLRVSGFIGQAASLPPGVWIGSPPGCNSLHPYVLPHIPHYFLRHSSKELDSSSSTERSSPVIPRCAKDLAAERDRPFASLRVTWCN